MAGGQRVEVAADKHGRLRIVFVDSIEEMACLVCATGGIGAVFEVHRNDSHPALSEQHLAADRHAPADARLAALRPEPSADGIQTDEEGAAERYGAGHGVAVEAFRVLGLARRHPLRIVANAQFDELDAMAKAWPSRPASRLSG